jgi:Na+-driven multidrug efflux pump
LFLIKFTIEVTDSSIQLTHKKIFYFWLPLAATWLMMAVEGPFLASLIARSTEPKFNLAAYGIAFSFALIIEAPIIMMMSAAIALVKNKQSFLKLKIFTYAVNVLITLIMLIAIIPIIFYFITETLIGLPEEISRLTHIATIILLPWPGAIGFRRFYQGILINNNLTRRVAYGTVVRLIAMLVCGSVLYISGIAEGVVIGAASLSFAVIMEAIAVRLMVSSTLKKINSEELSPLQNLEYKQIIKFYYPLALTSLIGLGVQPLLTFFIGQSRMAIESFAVLPVVTSFIFVFRSLGLSYQEVIIALLGEKNEGLKPLLHFAFLLALFLVGGLSLFAFTPLADFWFITVSGLSASLADFARVPLMIMFFFPALTVLISLQRGLLVASRNTKPITTATITEVLIIVIMMIILVNELDVIGVVAAMFALVAGRVAANVYLISSSFVSIKKPVQLN